MRASLLLASVSALALVTLPAAHLSTNAGAKMYVCALAQPAELDAAAYALLTWVEVKQVGNHGETGSKTNILSYDTWGENVIQKAKGNTNAGDPEIEYARVATDPGQIIMRDIAKTHLIYAFKIEYNDAATSGGTGTIKYNRGLVSGPSQPNGRSEDFNLEVMTLGLVQEQVIVEAT